MNKWDSSDTYQTMWTQPRLRSIIAWKMIKHLLPRFKMRRYRRNSITLPLDRKPNTELLVVLAHLHRKIPKHELHRPNEQLCTNLNLMWRLLCSSFWRKYMSHIEGSLFSLKSRYKFKLWVLRMNLLKHYPMDVVYSSLEFRVRDHQEYIVLKLILMASRASTKVNGMWVHWLQLLALVSHPPTAVLME